MQFEEFFADHDKEILSIIENATVGIAGAGGLGSNCAAALARAGIGKLIIADYDKVSASNLNRQYYFCEQIGQHKAAALKYNLKRMNPFCEYEIHIKKLDKTSVEEVFEDVDLLIEGFDEATEKEMLIETWDDSFRDIPLIVGSGIGGIGANALIKEIHSGNLYIIGDCERDVNEGYLPLAPRVGVIACMQANLALELLVEKYRSKGRNS